MNITHYRQDVAQAGPKPLGRPRLYDDEQRKQRHRESALRHYYKKQARKAPCFFAEQGDKDREALRGTV